MMRNEEGALAQLRAAIDAWGIGTFEWNHVDGRVTGSERFFELYASPSGDGAFGMPWSAVYASDRAKTRTAFELALDPAGTRRVDLIHRVQHAGDRRQVLHVRAHTRFEAAAAGQRPLATSGSVVDITERQRIEDQLRYTEARFDEAVRGAQFGIFEHNHIDDPGAENVYWSPRLREIFGFSADEPGSARKLLSRVHAEDIAMLHAAVARAHDPSGNGYYDVEHRYLHPILGLRWLLTRSSTHFGEVEGKRVPVRTVGAIIDISRERQLEDNMRQAQKMEAVGRLAGGIAHDFNNILSAILSFAHVAADEVGIYGKGYRELQEIISAGKRAASLTQQLLTFSRKQVLRPQVVDVGKTLTRAAPMLQRLMGERIDVTFTLDRSPLRVKVDPTHLEQVLLNLAINARDAMEHGGRLHIECHARTCEALAASRAGVEPGHYVVIAVSDNGVGMDAQTKAHVFEPFFTTKAAGRGTGLGLATVFGIVKQSGGGVQVDTELGQGSTFRAYFPASSEPLSEPSREPPQRVLADGGVIMVAEDDPAVRDVIVSILERAGYVVIAAANPIEAVERARERRGAIDLLLTDIVMPLSSGTELAERLCAVHPNLSVIYMSGYTDEDIFEHSALDAREHFLPKPIIPAKLLDTIATVLGRGPPLALG